MKKYLLLSLFIITGSLNCFADDENPFVAQWRDSYFDEIKENIKQADVTDCKGWLPFKKWIYAQVMLQFFPAEIKQEELEGFTKDAGKLASTIDLKDLIHFFHHGSKELVKKFICQLPEKTDVNPTGVYIGIYSQIYAPAKEPGQRDDKMNPSGVVFSLKRAFGS
jgi:hypothetical protein